MSPQSNRAATTSPAGVPMTMCHLLLVLLLIPMAAAADYHVDFASGDDDADGLTPRAPWKHAPGDPQATGRAAAVTLAAGDRVLLKGGVIYRGEIVISAAGAPDQPIVYDGGAWGEGRAVILGGDAVTGWTRCTSAEEAGGNPNWTDIWYADVPEATSAKQLNLADASAPLPVAQHPNPKDFFWQEHTRTFLVAPTVLEASSGARLSVHRLTQQNKGQPLSNLLTGNLAVIGPVPGGEFTFHLEAKSEIRSVGIAVQPKYAPLAEFAVLIDGKEAARYTLTQSTKGELQRFDLPRAVSAERIGFHFLSMHGDESRNWSKLKRVAAFDGTGDDLLKGADAMTFTDPERLNALSGGQADWFDDMTLAFHGGHNHICYLPIRGYDPTTGSLQLPGFSDGQYKQTRYCLFDSVRLIDQPGEYSVDPSPQDGSSRIFLLPRTLVDGQPAEVSRSARAHGVKLDQARHVVVQNVIIRQQNKRGFTASGGQDITLRDSEVTQVGGAAVTGTKVDGMVVERVHVHDNPGHTKGVVLHTCRNSAVRDCLLERNTSTALDYYVCADSEVIGCRVRENLGSHANGLTFYVGCTNILVARNHVSDGNVALTFQEGEGFVFRNNLLEGNLKTPTVGIWTSPPLKDVQFIHNTIVRGDPGKPHAVGLFANAPKIQGLVVRNNIIDGVYSDHDVFKAGQWSHNLYTRVAKDQGEDGVMGEHELVETDLSTIFVDPDQGDWRLRAGSPAIGMGTDAGVEADITGEARPSGRVDVGAFAHR